MRAHDVVLLAFDQHQHTIGQAVRAPAPPWNVAVVCMSPKQPIPYISLSPEEQNQLHRKVSSFSRTASTRSNHALSLWDRCPGISARVVAQYWCTCLLPPSLEHGAGCGVFLLLLRKRTSQATATPPPGSLPSIPLCAFYWFSGVSPA